MIHRDLIYLFEGFQTVLTLSEITTAAYTLWITATLAFRLSARLELVIQVDKFLDYLILCSSITNFPIVIAALGFVRN
jgi:hypothetical protein